MLDILQATPDLLAQVADSTEFISEPMRALLDSISAKTGQTAMNTARDSVDWEVIQITRKDYYIAIIAIVVATISLIVDIFTTIYQHTSSSNSKLLSAKLTLSVQKTIGADMIYRMYRNMIFLLALREQLILLNFKSYPSAREITRCKISNDLELDAICSKNSNLLKRWRDISHQLEFYNSDCDGLLETLKDSDIPNEIKIQELTNITKTAGIYASILFNLMNNISKDNYISEVILENIKRIVDERSKWMNEVNTATTSYEIKSVILNFIRMLNLHSDNLTENDILELMEKDFQMVNSRKISMIPINE